MQRVRLEWFAHLHEPLRLNVLRAASTFEDGLLRGCLIRSDASLHARFFMLKEVVGAREEHIHVVCTRHLALLLLLLL